jgi:hypothetical protein
MIIDINYICCINICERLTDAYSRKNQIGRILSGIRVHYLDSVWVGSAGLGNHQPIAVLEWRCNGIKNTLQHLDYD